jgi:16S rRNA (cytosine1402-N4)-methyltransferase
MTPDDSSSSPPFKRRIRYRGTHPRHFEDKYKELDPQRDPDTIAKVIASGKTPAGQHRPIMVDEILQYLTPQDGQRGADVTFGYGGHSEALLYKLRPEGQLLALDVDAVQLPKTEARLRGLGFGADTLIVQRSNFAGILHALTKIGWDDSLDFLLADLGLSSMQIDNPARGFSYKHDGPLDMRMNPERGIRASDWIARHNSNDIAKTLKKGGDETRSVRIAEAIIAAHTERPLTTTRQLRRAIETALPNRLNDEDRASTVARCFQAIRIAVNEEFSALEAFLRQLPDCLRPGGRVAILSFHSGEDRRVKHHFRDGLRSGLYAQVSDHVIRPTPQEIASNPRAAPAKLRWGVRCTDY